MCRIIMLQGCGSNVGKSMLVAGLCRAFVKRGLRVRPFKPQNMSNNAAVTIDGGEIGRAQALQALASGVPAHTDMNPVLLKPQSESGAQVIVQGKHLATVKAAAYAQYKPRLLRSVLESFYRLSKEADLILVEGAGSPAEVNLRDADIANMGFAEAVDAPVILVGDIDRGGVIAQLVGTHTVLPETDRQRIKGFLINKFRGDAALFSEGYSYIHATTQWQPLGVVPWFGGAIHLPAEDSMDVIRPSETDGKIRISVPNLSRIANFDDLDPLRMQPNITVEVIPAGRPLPREADLILLPGSKSTCADLEYIRRQGWDIDIHAHVRQGRPVVGLCGGFQMLGHTIHDPHGIEGAPGSTAGLGLLDMETVMQTDKVVKQVTGIGYGAPFEGYEIHVGRTVGGALAQPWLSVDGRPHGVHAGCIFGAYVHGLFASDAFRQRFFEMLGHQVPASNYKARVETTLDQLAAHMEDHVDLDAFLSMAHPVAA